MDYFVKGGFEREIQLRHGSAWLGELEAKVENDKLNALRNKCEGDFSQRRKKAKAAQRCALCSSVTAHRSLLLLGSCRRCLTPLLATSRMCAVHDSKLHARVPVARMCGGFILMAGSVVAGRGTLLHSRRRMASTRCRRVSSSTRYSRSCTRC